MARTKRIFTAGKDFILWNLFKSVLGIIKAIPLPFLPRFSRWGGDVILRVMPKRKNIALNNLEIALGKEVNKQEREDILKKSMSEVVFGGIEVLKYVSVAPNLVLNRIEFQGKEHLDRALEQGRGAICFSGHFGNFPIMMIAMRRMNYPTSMIIRDPKNAQMAKLLAHLSEQVRLGHIPDKPKNECLRRSLQCLGNNNILTLLLDVNVISGGIWAEFFGKLVPTYAGPVILALRTGAPIIPIFTYRNDTYFHKIIAGPPIPLETSGDKKKDLVTNLTRINQVIEKYIRQEPTAWWWLHRRWRKAKPL
jgi:KDO2-lipid IV(A) lauroyltransferase